MPRVISFVLLASLVAYGCGDSSTGPSSSTPPRGEFAQTDLSVGTGATATTGRFLSVNYSGWLYDPAQLESKGRHFQTGSHSFTLGIGAVIRGWDQGVPGMRVGGRRRLVIPPELGYGANGSSDGTIPPNASLVFDVELLAVQ